MKVQLLEGVRPARTSPRRAAPDNVIFVQAFVPRLWYSFWTRGSIFGISAGQPGHGGRETII